MEFLGDVELDRDSCDLDWRDIGEGQEVRPAQPVELDAGRRVKADIEQELVEHPAGQLGTDVISHRRTLRRAIQGARTFDGKAEEVVKVECLCRQQVGRRRVLVAGGRESTSFVVRARSPKR